MKKIKDFDCVEMKREIQAKLLADDEARNKCGLPLHIPSLPAELQECVKNVAKFQDRTGKKAS